MKVFCPFSWYPSVWEGGVLVLTVVLHSRLVTDFLVLGFRTKLLTFSHGFLPVCLRFFLPLSLLVCLPASVLEIDVSLNHDPTLPPYSFILVKMCLFFKLFFFFFLDLFMYYR